MLAFGQNTHKQLRQAEQTWQQLDASLKVEAKRHSAERLGLEARIAELEQCERDLGPWKDRQSRILYFLNLFPQLAEYDPSFSPFKTVLIARQRE